MMIRTDVEMDDILRRWGHWRTGIPMDMGRDLGPKVGGGEFESKLPGPVWFTPKFDIVQFRDVTDCVNCLPGVQRLAIEFTYLNPYAKLPEISARMGVKISTTIRYQEQARRMVSEWLSVVGKARLERAA